MYEVGGAYPSCLASVFPCSCVNLANVRIVPSTLVHRSLLKEMET